MTIRELQSLIAEIDSLLTGEPAGADRTEGGSEPRSPQDILKQVRPYLVSAQDRFRESEVEGGAPAAIASQPEFASEIATAVIQRIEGQRANWLQPWQMELETVRQQRNALLRDIQQLEGQRQQLASDFLKILLDRTSESLRQEMAQTLERIETQAIYARETTTTPAGAKTALPQGPSQRLEQLQQFQVQSDRLVMNLDSTFRNVFATLERDIQGYEQSLSAALGRLHALGLQGGVIRETHHPDSTFASSPSQPVSSDAPTQLQSSDTPTQLQSPAPTKLQPSDDTSPIYPFHGLELSSQPTVPLPSTADTDIDAHPRVDIEAMDDSEIDALLQLDDSNEEREQSSASEREREAIREGYTDPWDEIDPAQDRENATKPLENRLFGDCDDPALTPRSELENWHERKPEPVSVEMSLFETAGKTSPPPTEAIAASDNSSEPPAADRNPPENHNPSEPEASPPSEPEVSPPSKPEASPPSEQTTYTIASLSELLDQTYTDADAETETYSTVPLGESLIVEEDAATRSDTDVDRVLEDPQLNQQLDEDLERFGREGAIDLGKPPATSQEETTDAPPPELLGENLNDIDLEDLWAEEEQTSEVKPEANLTLPEEITTDPWSQPAEDGRD